MNIVDQIMRLVRRDQEEQIFSADVTAVNGNRVRIRRTSQPTDNQDYPTLATGESLAVGDEVLVVRRGRGAFVVLGKVQR